MSKFPQSFPSQTLIVGTLLLVAFTIAAFTIAGEVSYFGAGQLIAMVAVSLRGPYDPSNDH